MQSTWLDMLGVDVHTDGNRYRGRFAEAGRDKPEAILLLHGHGGHLAPGHITARGLASLLDTVGTANDLSPTLGMRKKPFTVTTIGVRKRVKTAQGLAIPVTQPNASMRPDIVLVPALGASSPSAAATMREVPTPAAPTITTTSPPAT